MSKYTEEHIPESKEEALLWVKESERIAHDQKQLHDAKRLGIDVSGYEEHLKQRQQNQED